MVLKRKIKKENIKNSDTDKDVVFEEDSDIENSMSKSFDKADKYRKLKEKLDKCIEENRQNLLGWQRARADFVNAQKENEMRVKESFDFARMKLIEDMLPVLDSFDMAFNDKEAWEKVDKNWRLGVEYIHSQMITSLEGNGLKYISEIGVKFDPQRHESVESVHTDKEDEDGCVVYIVQKGYEFKGKIIRPAKVKIGNYKTT